MSKHRFYVSPGRINEGRVSFHKPDIWHITKVLRLSKGQHVIVFDGTGREYRVEIQTITRKDVFGLVREEWEQKRDSSLHLTLVQGIPKANKMDLIVQKATEVGVTEIIPLNSERSQWGTATKHRQEAKVYQRLERWSRIGIEAAKQSCRTTVPLIRPVVTVEQYLDRPPAAELKLLLWEEEQHAGLKQILRAQSGAFQSAAVVIGPEGGFSAEEAQQFQRKEYQPVSLGSRILRTETAGIVVLGILQYEFGDY
ncbi:16S rRNA (uracil(1498)-N(3))-methyltransferase [candidate division KSB3 bacterium]|uniref:Ribosomal RNA small subunit methyltransferase E n=1 Tax=candidate division KSB3 bacterium TaxID=2044937 RepID=A0A2G6KGU7_9BACT|nr:MAG: 16S rRNA (uracil(1498)-N(3))-methyltransferase [candidate division KSB3 bacterium]